MKSRQTSPITSTNANAQNIAESIQWQLRYIFGNLTTKKSLKTIHPDILSLIEVSGNKYEYLLIQIPLEMIDIRDPKVQSGNKDAIKVQFFVQEIQRLSRSPLYLRQVPEAFENLVLPNIPEFIGDIFKTCKLRIADHLLFLLALSHSWIPEIRQEAIKQLRTKLQDYYTMGQPQQLPIYATHRLLYLLQQTPEFAGDSINPTYSCKEIAQFLKDTITESAATALSIELMPLTTHHFSCIQSGFPSNDEFMSKKGQQAGRTPDLGSVLLDLEPCVTHYYPLVSEIVQGYAKGEVDYLASQIAEAMIKLANAISCASATNTTGYEALPEGLPKNVGVTISKVFYSSIKAGMKMSGLTPDGTIPTNNESNKHYNLDNLALSFREAFQSKKEIMQMESKNPFDQVIEACDSPTITMLRDTKALQTFASLYTKFRQTPFPLVLLLNHIWKHIDFQVYFLELVLQIYDNELFNFDSSPRKQPKIDSIQGIKSNVLPSLSAWCSIDLVERLIELSDSQHYLKIRSMFEYPLKNCPEYLFLSLAQTKPQNGLFLLEELYAILLPMFLSNHVNSIIVLEKLWKLNQKLMVRAMSNLYKYDPNMMNLSRVLDITQEIKDLLLTIVNTEDHEFTIPLGILAGKRDFLHFDQWLCERIRNVGEPFVEALLNYLEENFLKKNTGETLDKKLEKSYLTKEKLAVIFENMCTKQKALSDLLHKRCSFIQSSLVQMYPDIIMAPSSSEEVEEEANRWFQKVFSSEVGITDLINCMKRYKTSSVQKENEIFACMIHNLLDEYRFFSKYPDKELKITGQLFGSIIQNRLVEGLLERISIKYVFEALKRNGKMQKFGVLAVEQFIERLKEWPHSIELILKLPNFRQNNPELAQKIQIIYDSAKASGAYTSGSSMGIDLSPTMGSIDSPGAPNQLILPPAAQYPGSDIHSIAGPAISIPSHPGIPGSGSHIERSILGNIGMQYKSPPLVAPGDISHATNSTPPPSQPVPQFYPPVPGQANPRMNLSPNPAPPMMWPGVAGPLSNPIPIPVPGTAGGNQFSTDPGIYGETHVRPQNDIMQNFPGYSGERQALEKEMPLEKKVPAQPTIHMEEIKVPSPIIVEKINLQLNLVTEQELRNVVDVLKICIKDDESTRNWLANTIVERASSQPNNHKLFLQMASSTDKDLLAAILKYTYKHIQIIMSENSGDVPNSIQFDQAKKQIKNLGAFLGLMTIAKNRPILAKELDLKQILIEGHKQGCLKLQILLVCQILRQSYTSTVFKPSNPWMRVIICLLGELNAQLQDSKTLNLKYEIINMFEFLKIDSRQFPPSNILPAATKVELGTIENKPQSIIRPVPKTYRPLPPPEMGPIHRTSPAVPENYQPPIGPPQLIQSPSPSPQLSIGKISINPEIMKQCEALGIYDMSKIQSAIETSIKDILKPVIERSVTIALITTRELVLKDFALESSESKLSEATDQMVQSLAGSLAMVTCKEPLRMSMQTRLKEKISSLTNIDPPPTKAIDQIISSICKENLDVGSAHIQNSVILKAQQKVSEDQAIKEAIERKMRRQPSQNAYLATFEQLPVFVRPKKEGLSPLELNVYKDFKTVLKQNTMGTQPPQQAHAPHPPEPSPIPNAEEQQMAGSSGKGQMPRMGVIKLDEMMRALQEMTESSANIYHDSVKGLLKRFNSDLQEYDKSPKQFEKLIKDTFLRICFLASGKPWEKITHYRFFPNKFTEYLFTDSSDEVRYHWELHTVFFKKNLIELSIFDNEFSKTLQKVVGCAPEIRREILTYISILVQRLWIEEKVISQNGFQNIFRQLEQISRTPIAHENPHFMKMLNELYKQQTVSTKDFKALFLRWFDDWINFSQQDQNAAQFDTFISKMMDTLNIRSQDENCFNYFLVIIRTSIAHALYNTIPIVDGEQQVVNYPDRLDYRYIDHAAILMYTFIMGDSPAGPKYFQNFMKALAKVLHEEHKQKLTHFNQRPFYRFFARVLTMLFTTDSPIKDNPEFQIVFTSILHELCPINYPAFAFAWLEIISHHLFLSGLLKLRVESKYPVLFSKFAILLCDMFQFLKNAWTHAEVQIPAAQQYFEACMKITFVIWHDFPDFVANHYYEFLCAIPDPSMHNYTIPSPRITPSAFQPFIQLKNLILSAQPLSIKTSEAKRLKTEKMPELKIPPSIYSDYKQVLIKSFNIKEDVDKFVASKNTTNILDICNKLMTPEKGIKQRAELDIHHALVLYLAEIGIRSGDQQPEELSGSGLATGRQEIGNMLRTILNKLDIPSRDLFLNAMINELRYPNAYTHFFIIFLSQIMQDSSAIFLQEQILRILLERKRVNLPHPWGLGILFNEIQNPKYDLKNKPFVKNYKEIENILMHLRDPKGGKED